MTKKSPKIEQYRNVESFYVTKWSKQSVTTHDISPKKLLNQKNFPGRLMSEIELHRDEK